MQHIVYGIASKIKNEAPVRKSFTILILLLLFSCLSLSAQVTSSFTADALYGCPPLQVNFQDQSTGNPTSYYWSFGNGNFSNFADASATFINFGIYDVMHVVSNGTSTDTHVIQIHVFQPPTVDFTSTDNVGCIFPCHTVHFTNLSTPGESPIVESVWDFGDGSLPISGFEVERCYNQPGKFNVTLVVRDSNTCQANKVITDFVHIGLNPVSSSTATPVQSCNSPQLVNFTGSGTSTNGALDYYWLFGNSGVSFSQNPSQVFFSGIYDPMLIVTDTLGCQDTSFTHIEITDVQAGFTVPSLNGCRGIPVQFTDTSNFASSWLWNFGDGNTSTQQHPAHAYVANGTYTVTLIVTYGICSDTVVRTAYINVSTPLNFTMSANDTSACAAPLSVNFTSSASGAVGYNWNFGDGNTSTLQNPTHTYTANGTYTVTLGVSNSAGCVNTRALSSAISIGTLQAAFSIDSNRGCTPMVVQFTDMTVSNSAITSYLWSFGDGTTSTQQNPLHTYPNSGTYVPMLIVQNAEGCRDTVVYADTIRIGQTLNPAFTATPLIQCINQLVSFTNLTTGATGSTTYLWQFGDGQTSNLANPTHAYSDTGHFDISLTVINQGCPNTVVRLQYIQIIVPKADFRFDFDCSNPTTVTFIDNSQEPHTWFWDFGDGTTSTQQSPTHTFPGQSNYTVTLTVYNSTTGCTDELEQEIPIGTPAAAFTADTLAGCYPLEVAFTDTSVFASSWLWVFGDGDSSDLQNPTHTYMDTGQYTVTLIINPNDSCSDMVVKPAYITAYGVKGLITAVPTLGCAPLTVAFRDSSVSFMGSVVTWAWRFRGTDSSFVSNPTYTFTNGLNSTTTLRVTDSHGCQASDAQQIRPRILEARFISDSIACPGESIRFTNRTTNIGGNTYTWIFGDGTTSPVVSPTHTYATPGTYTVFLVARSSTYGCVDTSVGLNVNVADPIADFFPESDFASCPPFPVQFRNLSNRNDLQWLWYFGDGDTSTTFDPLHVYKFPGDYDVSLIAWTSAGCRDTITYIELIRLRGPLGNFTASPDSGCAPLTIQITGTVSASTEFIHADLGDGFALDGLLNITHTYDSARNYYPSFTLQDSLGCTVVYPVDTIVVGDYPRPQLNDTTVCEGNYVQFNLPEGDNFVWSSNSTTEFLSCLDCRNPLSSSLDTITYFVTATTNIGCSATDTVTVYTDPLPELFPGLSFRICPNDTLQLFAGTNADSVVWTPSLYMNDSTLLNPLVWPPDSMVYRVTAGNNSGCTISRIVRVDVITHVLSDVTIDTALCDGGSISFNLNVLQASYNDTSFFWSPSTNLSSATVEDPVFDATTGDYTYTVIVSSGGCIADTNTVHVAVEPMPTVEAGDDQTVAVGATVQLWAASPENVTYQWIPVDELSCTDCRRPFLTATQSQTIPVVATNYLGCTDTAFVDIRVVTCDENMVYVPNTFTPNSDGLNDQLFVRGIVLNNLEYFRVFDRWGKLVWETKDVKEGWDGTINGRKADIATYAYLLKGNCSGGSDVFKSGNVTLVR